MHQIGRGPYAPSLTPFAVKLETYLRMANIPYQNVHSLRPSPKGKFPWIEYNGQVISDSQFIIEFLNKTKKVDMNSHLSVYDKALARAFQKMLEENTYWTYTVLALLNHDVHARAKVLHVYTFQVRYYRRILKNQAYNQGMGRHTEEEVLGILKADLQALSTFLGANKFLFGDRPCETDCAVFGSLTVPYYNSFGEGLLEAIEEFPNLCEYCDRMKETFWPDWEDCITHGGTRKATK